MGDIRFERQYEKLQHASQSEREQVLHKMADGEVIEALAAASRAHDPFHANVLATEALNRMRRLRAALASMGEGVAALALDGRIHWLNPAAEAILGWRLDEVTGNDFHALVGHRDARGRPVPRDASPILRAGAERAPVEGDCEFFRTRAGADACITYTASPIVAETGEVLGTVVAFRDSELRLRMERELRAERERYKSLFDAIPYPIIDVGLDGRIIDANRAAEELTRRPIRATREHDLFVYVHPDDAASTERLFFGVIEGRLQEATLRILHADGHYVRVRAIGVPIVVEGKVVGVHGIVRKAD